MIKTEVTWHSVQERPNRSTDVIIVHDDMEYAQLVHYSKQKERFNDYDNLPDDGERNVCGENVRCWCYVDELTACLFKK